MSTMYPHTDASRDSTAGALRDAYNALVRGIADKSIGAQIEAMDRANVAVEAAPVDEVIDVFSREWAMSLHPYAWTIARDRLKDVDRKTEPRAVLFDEFYDVVWD